METKPEKEIQQGAETPETSDRREAVRKLGRFAAYAAPFTVLAFTNKASAASGGGPTPLSRHH